MSLTEKTEFPFFEFPIFRYCRWEDSDHCHTLLYVGRTFSKWWTFLSVITGWATQHHADSFCLPHQLPLSPANNISSARRNLLMPLSVLSDSHYCLSTTLERNLNDYRWFPLNPNWLIAKWAFIRSFLKTMCQSLLCCSACLIRSLPKSKDFHLVRFTWIKQDPHVLNYICWWQ